jgi:hypothetical protein
MSDENISDIFSGEWVLLFEDRIIDHSYNIQDMLVLAEEKFPSNKYPHGTVRIKKVFQGSPREILIEH